MYKRNGKKLSIENAMGENVILIAFDITLSNISKIIDTYEKHLETAYKISNKISANPLLNKKFGINIPLITEGISLDEIFYMHIRL